MKYKLIIFDFDGTLADSFPFALSVMDSVADRFGIRRVDRNEIDTLRGIDPHKLIRRYRVPFWKIPSIARHVRALQTAEIHQISLFAGVDRMLETLADQGVQLAIVTTNSFQNVQKVLGPANTARIRYFECGVSIFGKYTKFRKILRKSGIRHHETLCIGDEIRDMVAAKKAHIPFGAVSWGFTTVEALKAHFPHELFTSVDEIAQKIQ